MTKPEEITERPDQAGALFTIFSIWTFIVLCRPQDYLSLLGKIRPSLTLGLITLLIYFSNSGKSEKISNDNQFRMYRYLLMVMILGVPFSYYRSASMKDVFYYASITTMFFYLFYQLVNTFQKLLSLLFAYCSGVAVYAIYILISGNFSSGRIYFGSMFDPNDIAYFIISFLTFNFLFISKNNRGYMRIISVINILISLIVILKTGSRGGLIALIAVLAFLLFKKSSTIKLSIVTKSAFVLIAIISLQFISMDTERYKTILDVQDDYNITGEEGRIAIWKTGMKLMLTHPLTGVGFNRFYEAVGQDREKRGLPPKWQTAHNSLVQIGAETGIIGLILFCLMSLNVFRITRLVIDKARSIELVKLSEMARVGFIGLFISAMFLSQAYSIYWAFYIVLSAVLKHLLDKETETAEIIA